MTARKIAFYSHDTMGLGHIRRNMLLASSISKCMPDVEILLINGSRESGIYRLSQGIDTLTLPGYKKTLDGKYTPLTLGKDINNLVKLRSSIISSALDSFEPDIVIVDNVPRGAMFELDCALAMLKRKGTHIILGLRDIIDEPESVNRQWLKLNNNQAIDIFYDDVWVYGDENIYDIRKYYQLPQSVKLKISFLGYLNAIDHNQQESRSFSMNSDTYKPYVLCMVGGGQDGFMLASTFAQARYPQGCNGIIVAGAKMPEEDYENLCEIASKRDDLSVIRMSNTPLKLIHESKSVVTMGGYNTTLEILCLAKKALIIPRVSPRQEQWVRSSQLAGKNLISCIHPDDFTLDSLNDWLASEWQPDDPSGYLNLKGIECFLSKISTLLKTIKKHNHLLY